MASPTPPLARARVGLLAGAALAAGSLVIAACSSSGGGGTATAAAGNGGGGGGGTHAKTVVVETHSGPLGTYLTDGSGKTLYEFASDSMNKSNCTGACLSIWPALTTSGQPKAMSGGQSGKLGTISASNGTKQVTYAGHPLYYYSGDSSAGSTNGQGLNQFGGLWWVVSSSGQPITSSGSGGSSSSSSGGGGGGGSWG